MKNFLLAAFVLYFSTPAAFAVEWLSKNNEEVLVTPDSIVNFEHTDGYLAKNNYLKVFVDGKEVLMASGGSMFRPSMQREKIKDLQAKAQPSQLIKISLASNDPANVLTLVNSFGSEDIDTFQNLQGIYRNSELESIKLQFDSNGLLLAEVSNFTTCLVLVKEGKIGFLSPIGDFTEFQVNRNNNEVESIVGSPAISYSQPDKNVFRKVK